MSESTRTSFCRLLIAIHCDISERLWFHLVERPELKEQMHSCKAKDSRRVLKSVKYAFGEFVM